MKRLFALMLAVAAASPVALAQPLTEPRLAGGPERVCSEDEIRRALDGSYAGTPCRFTEIPDGLDMTPQRPAAQPAAVQAQRAQTLRAPQPNDPVQQTARREPITAPHSPARSVSYSESLPPMRQRGPATQRGVVLARHEGNSFIASQQSSSVRTHAVERTQASGRQWPQQQVASTAGRPAHHRESGRDGAEHHRSETVRLSDDFFSGGLVGGVERPFAPVYSYRGLILIAADGQVRTGHAGLSHRVSRLRALDHRPAPLPHAVPRRSYP